MGHENRSTIFITFISLPVNIHDPANCVMYHWCEYKKEPWQHVIWTRWCITITRHIAWQSKKWRENEELLSPSFCDFRRAERGTTSEPMRWDRDFFFYNPHLAQMMLVSHFIWFNIKDAPHTVYNYGSSGRSNKQKTQLKIEWMARCFFWVETKKKQNRNAVFFFMYIVVECTGDCIHKVLAGFCWIT